MNASDITNFIGLSPGLIGSLNGNGTSSITADVNCEIEANAFNISSSTATVTLNGIVFISFSTSAGQVIQNNISRKVQLRKGQTATFVLSAGVVNNTSLFLSARSIS